MGKLYVAYGSNLNLKQMAYRCPSASIYGTGQLTNWELLYRGSATNSHATIAKKHGMSLSAIYQKSIEALSSSIFEAGYADLIPIANVANCCLSIRPLPCSLCKLFYL